MVTEEVSFTIIGAGATGALLAARLTESGHRVTVVARGDSLTTIRENGIRVVRADGSEFTAHPHRVASPDEDAGETDVTIFLVKTYDTEKVARTLAQGSGYVLCLQNGIENEEILARHVGEGRVIPGVLYVGVERRAPGVVAYAIEPRVVFGRGGADAGAPIEGMERAFAASGIDVEIEADIVAAKWQKFVFNCGLNPLTAVTGMKLGPILDDEEGTRLFSALIGEAIAAGAAVGAPVGANTHDKVMETGRRMNISSSMAEDLAAGRPTELEAFSGYVRRLGRTYGVDTPVTDVFYGLLRIISAGRQ